ncbi:PREDICTED: arginase, hepatic [Nicrophorus vespilloides]|uniref:Arginase n=1 Tax=Nicrophorus vespilloides TaxID=110193 RepID=A0ABM1MQF7_NICVS|nr:PREDICTED: arginase, hepatic [Nicrophorus vespilloides]
MLKKRGIQVLFNCIKRNLHNDGLKVGILGIPFDKGQPRIGVGNGPRFIRDAGLIKRIQSIDKNMDIKDYGDVSYTVSKDVSEEVENMREYEHMASCCREVSKNVAKIINDGRICLSLGGDHSIGLGTVDGHIQAKSDNIAVLWIDAHADLNTNKTSATGNVHGMPMALLAKELSDYWPYLPGMDWQKPMISLRNIAYVGLRDVDVYERLVIDKLGITAFGIEDIEKYGIHSVINMALEKVDPYQNRSIHVSYDIDSLDALEAPSTGTAVRGGLTLREGIHLMEMVANTGRLGAIDLVEVNPSIGSASDVRNTVDAAIHIIMASLGHKRQGLRIKKIQEMPLQTFPPTRDLIN